MNRFFKVLVICFLFIFSHNFSHGQNIKKIDYSIKKNTLDSIKQFGEIQIQAEKFKTFELDIESLRSQLNGVMKTSDPTEGFIGQIQLPHPDGNVYLYNVKLNTTMSEGLQEKFPEIKSYNAYGVDFPAKAKIDITPHGFHAMIMQSDESTIYIDPAVKENTNHYIVYHRKDFKTENDRECLVTTAENDSNPKNDIVPEKSYLSCELRTFRLALAATVEYTNFHGGTKADAIAAQVTTMNRVNGIYERDLGLTMTIIPNNDLIVYEGNPNDDPFTNGDAYSMLFENQNNTDAIIGSANYDIGHVFGTNSGGVALLGSICENGQKAAGVTGSFSPINDPFDVDYVAHEMGHQFGANHTQNNNCNRNNATAMEPGSASTIMGYAGICSPNIQSNSDDHFHGVSLAEMGNRISATSCAVHTPITNAAPVISGTNANVHVPANTPFALTAFATDADGDVLSYCWEQMDNQISTQPPVSNATGGPNFRSYSPVNNPTRYFPSLSNQISSSPVALNWEVIPSVSRTMNFRITVRDQPLNIIGCNDFTDVTVTTVADAGPFVVLYPSEEDIAWEGFDDETVTWDVAQTNEAPINCDTVDIFLSTDGGLTYPITLANNVPNTGSAEIVVPNLSTTTARVMVMCSSGTFFDISDNNFEIAQITNEFFIHVKQPLAKICKPENAEYIFHLDSIVGFDDSVSLSVSGLPSGAIATFNNQTVKPTDSSVLTISNTDEIDIGDYAFTVAATSSTETKTTAIELVVRNSTPAEVIQLSPPSGSGSDPLEWEASPEIGVTYDIQIASDEQFNTIIDEASGLTTTNYTSSELGSSDTYYWRIRAVTECGKSQWTIPYFDEEKVRIFPNPTLGDLSLYWVGKVYKIEVSDVTGKLVEHIQIKKGTSTNINLNKHRAGVYHITIFSNTGRFIYDIIRL